MTIEKRFRIAAALWGGFLFLVTSWPTPPNVTAGGLPLDKLTHFGLYAVEGFLLFRAVAWPGRSGGTFARVLAIIGTLALVGALDEVHQEWIPGRGMESMDLVFDVVGAAAGAAAAGLTAARPSFRRPRRSGSAG